jgi:PHP family Zn ribbon phosphoesterase
MPMNFSADFHIHARFSRAASKKFDFEQLPIAVYLSGLSQRNPRNFT